MVTCTRRVLLISVAGVVLGVVVRLPAGGQTNRLSVDLVDALSSPQLEVRRDAAARLLADRETNIRALVQVVSADDAQQYPTAAQRRDSPKRAAIFCLGALRADNDAALSVLWANLDYRQTIEAGTLHEVLDPGSYYPAAAALVRIGKPACARAWKELESTTDPVRRDLASYVLLGVEGEDALQLLLDCKLDRFVRQAEVLANATPHKHNLEQARAWVMSRGRNGKSGGGPPTIGGQPLVDWSTQPFPSPKPVIGAN